MTISYTLQPVPEWYFPDLTGKPLAGGKMYTYSSLNPSQFKPVFQDPSGTNQWPNPVIFSENGTAGPFYWKLDSDDPDDLYFIQIFDSSNNLIYSINQYPISGGGGGGSVNTVQNIENLIINSAFINNIDTTSVQPISNYTLLCPGAHQYLIYPDITYIQSGVSNAQDTITFNQFTTGTNPLTPDFATPYYLNYTCLNNPTGETYKGIRIPISQNVNSIANQIFTFVFYGRVNSGSDSINVQLLQYFGSGGSPSSPVTTNLTPSSITLTSSFAVYSINFSIPTVATKNLGNSNDDGTYIEILFPIGSQCNIDIAKPSLYIGSTFPNVFYESVDETTYEIETPRTGDVKTSLNSFSMTNKYGWIPLNDGTIGNSSSNATTRAKPDAWLLYKLIWENTTSSYCPVYDNSGVIVSKGGSALSDWNSNRQIQLPRTVGKVLANKGTGTVTSLSYSTLASYVVVSSTSGFKDGDPIMFSVNAPVGLQVDVIYYVRVASATQLLIYLSQNIALNPISSNFTFSDGTTGTISTPPNLELGRFEGESAHVLSINEMPAHNHPGSVLPTNTGIASSGGGGLSQNYLTLATGSTRPVTVASQGSGYPHNTMQPTVFYNMIIKL